MTKSNYLYPCGYCGVPTLSEGQLRIHINFAHARQDPYTEVSSAMPVENYRRTKIDNAMKMYSFVGGITSKARVVAMGADGKRVPISAFYDPVTEEIVIVKQRKEDAQR